MSGLAERIKRGFKPREVEELIDYYYHRPLAGLMVQILLPLPFTPNQVTVASGVASLLAGVAMGYTMVGPEHWVAIGGGLLLLSILLDCADGQLARLRGIASPAGRILDGLVDVVAPVAVFSGQALFLGANGYSTFTIVAIGAGAGVSLLWHVGQFDVVKNIYLRNARPDFDVGGDAILTAEYVERLRKEYAAKGETFNSLLMWGFNKWWLKTQAKMGSADVGADAPHAETDEEQELFRSIYRVNMRVWTYLGFGTHLFLLTVSAWLAVWDPRAVWAAWLTMLVPMNLLCAVLLARRGRLQRDYNARLFEGRSQRNR